MTIDVYVTNHQHSRIVGEEFARQVGGSLRSVHAVRPGEAAVYGILRGTDKIIRRGNFWYIDHGYINPGHYDGYYRVCRNSLHARLGKPDFARLQHLNWKCEDHDPPPAAPILVAPPSFHTAKFLGAEAWLANVCAEIGKYTGRRIVVTDKINAPGERMLRSAYCLVTLQSNLSVEAIRQGVPVFIAHANMPPAYWHPAQEFSRPLSDIENPYHPEKEERMNWAARIAAVQWRLKEMGEGFRKEFNQGAKPFSTH